MSGDKRDDGINYKQVSIGGVTGASLIGLLMSFQNQGIDLVSKNNASQSQVVIEKTIANTERINRLEETVKNLNDKIDRG